MLKRMQLRRYLMALLSSEIVPQSAECETGPLYIDCNDKPVVIYDSATHQIFENVEASQDDNQSDLAIEFQVESEELTLTKTAVDKNIIRFSIDIIARVASGYDRQNLLDDVQEKILYRFVSGQTFEDNQTGEKLYSFMRWLDSNALNIGVSDDTEYDGSTTIRQMAMVVSPKECIKNMGCSDKALCIDFVSLIPKGACNGRN